MEIPDYQSNYWLIYCQVYSPGKWTASEIWAHFDLY